MDHGNVITISNLKEWEERLDEAAKANKIVLVDFTASWCPPCRAMAPFFADMSKKITSIVFLKVDVDENEAVAKAWEVHAMPTFIFIKDKKLLHKIVGAQKDELEKKALHFSSTPS